MSHSKVCPLDGGVVYAHPDVADYWVCRSCAETLTGEELVAVATGETAAAYIADNGLGMTPDYARHVS